jgi:hypothetical protein
LLRGENCRHGVGTESVHVQDRTGSHWFCELCSERKPVRPISLHTTSYYSIPNGSPGPSTARAPIWPGPIWPDPMRPDGFFVPGRVGHRAELAAQARPYGRFFGPGRHDAEVGPMGRDPARHYRRRRGGRGRDTGGAWRSARPELRRPTAQAGTAVTPAPHGASGQGRPEPHPCSGARRQSRGGPRW